MLGNFGQLQKRALKFSFLSLAHIVELVVPWLTLPVEGYKK